MCLPTGGGRQEGKGEVASGAPAGIRCLLYNYVVYVLLGIVTCGLLYISELIFLIFVTLFQSPYTDLF